MVHSKILVLHGTLLLILSVLLVFSPDEAFGNSHERKNVHTSGLNRGLSERSCAESGINGPMLLRMQDEVRAEAAPTLLRNRQTLISSEESHDNRLSDRRLKSLHNARCQPIKLQSINQGTVEAAVAASEAEVASEVVLIPDENLDESIRDELGIPTGDLTDADMAGLFFLYAEDLGIADLSGLEYAVNLEYLNLSFNEITDITPISGLTSLYELELAFNYIEDISPLEGLDNLEYLYIPVNEISDISPLSGLTSLLSLEIWSNYIEDISPLESLDNLLYLDLDSNYISDVSPLAALVNLEELWLPFNEIEDLDGLQSLSNLEYLFLDYNFFTSLQPIAGLENLRWLDISGNEVTGLDPIGGLVNLEHLDISYTGSSNLSEWPVLPELEVLSSRGNEIGDISALSLPASVMELELSYNLISDISPLLTIDGLDEYDEIDLRHNPLSANSLNNVIPQLEQQGILVAITPQTSFEIEFPDPNLEAQIRDQIDVPQGPITNVDVSDETFLFGDALGISSLQGLEHVAYLQWIWLDHNSIVDISPLAQLEWVDDFDLHDNNVVDLSPLLDNEGLRDSDWLEVQDNPLSNQSIQDVIPALIARGVYVLFDPAECEVDFQDAGLEAAVRDSLGVFTGAITCADMAELYDLFGSGYGISDLSGLEHAHNLWFADLSENLIEDIAPLGGLTNLNLLDLESNMIEDVQPLDGLQNLWFLDIGENQIVDITPLTDLDELEDLDISDNFIEDITPLAGLHDVWFLDMDSNLVADLSPLESLEDLIVLDVDTNLISDISPLAVLNNLEELDIRFNTVVDISPLQGLEGLWIIELGYNLIVDIAPLVNNAGIDFGDYLDLDANPLSPHSVNNLIPELEARGVLVVFTPLPGDDWLFTVDSPDGAACLWDSPRPLSATKCSENVISLLSGGEQLEVLEQTNEFGGPVEMDGYRWWRVRTTDGSGIEGWVTKETEDGVQSFLSDPDGDGLSVVGTSGVALRWTPGILEMHGEEVRADVLIVVPNDWVVENLHESFEGHGFDWQRVQSNDIEGWMPRFALDSGMDLLVNTDSAAAVEIEDEGDRLAAAVEAVDHYFANNSSTSSLYSSDDGSNGLSGLEGAGFSAELLLALLAEREPEGSDNEYVTFDFGHGALQVSFVPNSDTLNGFDNRGIGSSVIVPPCAIHNGYYSNCYAGNVILPLVAGDLLDMIATVDEVGNPVTSDGYFWWKVRSPLLHEDGWVAAGLVGNSPSNLEIAGGGKVRVLMDGLPFRSAPQVIETGYMEHDALGGRELKSYVNTRQSIYANVKDGLRVLQEKLDIVQQEQSQVCPISLGSTGLELSCSELMLISALWLYSDDRQADTLFLDLAERLANLDSLFPGRQFDNSGNLIEKLQAVNDSSEEVLIYSAGALVVADSEGNRTGTFNGSKHFEIDNSLVDSVGEKIMVFFPESEYTYQITGQAAGEYSLVVSKHDSSGGQQIRALDIPMGTGQETHQYQIDWAALAAGDNAVYGNVDFDSDGSFDTGFESGPEISFASFVSSAYTCGDLDLSGGLGISDALVGLNTVTGAIVTRRQIELLGDINSDSKFTVIDVIHILQAIVGIAEQPPRC